MRALHNNIKQSFWVGTMLLLVCSLTHADDTEIYFGTSATPSDPTSEQPNVVFILDSSGSMDEDMTSRAAYNPATTYGSSDDDYVYVYYSDWDVAYINNDNDNDQISIAKSSLTANCSSGLTAVAVAATPYYYTKAVYENGGNSTIDNHRELDNGTDMDSDEQVWCEDDAGAYASNPAGWGSGDCSNWDDGNCNDYYYLASANYHDYLQTTPATTDTKRNIMVSTAKQLVDQFTNLNMGIMRFNYTEGGYVLKHMTSTDTDANRTDLKATLDTIPASDYTPLSEALWEAYLYFNGATPEYGGSVGDSAAKSSGSYVSPIVSSCQKNHIVYLTDGAPTRDVGETGDTMRDRVQALQGSACSSEAFGTHGDCLDDLAGYLYNNDLSSSLDGVQNVTVHTIGFGLDGNNDELEYLDKTAIAGGDSNGVYQADSADELIGVFNQIVSGLADEGSTFTAPAVSASSYNSLQSSDSLYYALFKPADNPRWNGNVKKYQINDNAQIVDQNGYIAVDPNTGFFADDAQSFWSDDADGSAVVDGGVASELKVPASRNLYTDVDGAGGAAVSIDAAAVTAAMLGAADNTERDAILQWARGLDTDGSSPLFFMSDVLHSRPVVVYYPDDDKEVIYVGGNNGLLHAFDAEDGIEHFAFVPEELLPNLKTYYDNTGTHEDRAYGMDGEIIFWQELDETDGSMIHTYLYATQRRGGNNLYALDVTDYDTPALLWQIDGTTTGFGRLGQTWSKPTLVMVKWPDGLGGLEEKEVLFFGGGYDTYYDTATLPGASAKMGNAIYMVDASTGDLLWSASETGADVNRSNMIHSFVSQIHIRDKNSDGVADTLLAVDIAGQLWRFDFSASPTSAADFVSGGDRIAQLGDYDGNTANDATNFRRFYNGLSVAYAASSDTTPLWSITTASGWREKPLDETISDRIYTIFDRNPFAAPSDYTYVVNAIINEGNLQNTSTWDETDGISYYGWYRPLESAVYEKGLSNSLTLGDVVLTTTYVPGASVSACSADTGSSRFYSLDVLTGQSTLDTEYKTLISGGIAPEPVILRVASQVPITYYNPDGAGTTTVTETVLKSIIVVGTETVGTTGDGSWQDAQDTCSQNPDKKGCKLGALNFGYWQEN